MGRIGIARRIFQTGQRRLFEDKYLVELFKSQPFPSRKPIMDPFSERF